MLHTAPAWSRALIGDRVGSTIDDGRSDERQLTAHRLQGWPDLPSGVRRLWPLGISGRGV
jgi:hypothetical protein